jgi:hypothetical protein
MRRTASIALGLVLLFQSVSLKGQTTTPEPAFQVNGQPLFVLRMGVGSFSPAERARAINQQLEEILKSSPAKMEASVKESDAGWLIMVGDRPIISVTEKDAEGKSSARGSWRTAGQARLERAFRKRPI